MNEHLELCVCKHARAAHDENDRCLICEAQANYCAGYWSKAEYTAAVNSGLLEILRANAERKRAHQTK